MRVDVGMLQVVYAAPSVRILSRDEDDISVVLLAHPRARTLARLIAAGEDAATLAAVVLLAGQTIKLSPFSWRLQACPGPYLVKLIRANSRKKAGHFLTWFAVEP